MAPSVPCWTSNLSSPEDCIIAVLLTFHIRFGQTKTSPCLQSKQVCLHPTLASDLTPYPVCYRLRLRSRHTVFQRYYTINSETTEDSASQILVIFSLSPTGLPGSTSYSHETNSSLINVHSPVTGCALLLYHHKRLYIHSVDSDDTVSYPRAGYTIGDHRYHKATQVVADNASKICFQGILGRNDAGTTEWVIAAFEESEFDALARPRPTAEWKLLYVAIETACRMIAWLWNESILYLVFFFLRRTLFDS